MIADDLAITEVEDLGDLSTGSIPMLLDSGLDQLKVVLGDSSFF